MTRDRSRRSGVAAAAVFVAASFGLACIDVREIRAPITDASAKTSPPDAATDAETDGARGSVALGGPCAGNLDCAFGSCVDGVCCEQGSCPLCKTCGPSGQCVNVTAGVLEPHARCFPVDPPESCGHSGACDGSGACAYYPVNLTCAKGVCDGDAVVGAYACDGAGQCKPASTRICVPFRCDSSTNDCVDTCTSNDHCVAGHQCTQGSCGLKSKGASCQRNEDCASGYCTDGVCCNVACQGACLSCNLMGHEGTCWPIDVNQPDPRRICVNEGSTSCLWTGGCDGLGYCLYYDATTPCGQTCAADGSTLTTTYCDGMGKCGPMTEVTTCPTNTCNAGQPTCQ